MALSVCVEIKHSRYLALKSTDVQLGPLTSSKVRWWNSSLHPKLRSAMHDPMLISFYCTRDAIDSHISSDILSKFLRYWRMILVNFGTELTMSFNKFVQWMSIAVRPVLSFREYTRESREKPTNGKLIARLAIVKSFNANKVIESGVKISRMMALQ